MLAFGCKINLLVANVLWILSLPVWFLLSLLTGKAPDVCSRTETCTPLLGEKVNCSQLETLCYNSALCWVGGVTQILHQACVGKYLVISACVRNTMFMNIMLRHRAAKKQAVKTTVS